MKKISIIGAGSTIFSQKIINDVLLYEELQDSCITLMDINTQKLENTNRLLSRLVHDNHLPAVISKTTSIDKAIEGSDFIVIMIDTPGTGVLKHDNLIPKKYGIDQVVGDTLGPGGVFKALRLIPQVIAICKKAEQLCPEALIINYVNPMAMITWAINEATKMKAVGICHGVKGTVRRLADFLEIPQPEIDYWIAGINHMAWVLRFEHQGRDLYPEIWKKLGRPAPRGTEKPLVKEMYDEKYRIEMMKATGYFMTETSGHLSEYLPYFRKRNDLIKKYDGYRGWDGTSMYYYRTIGKKRIKHDVNVNKMSQSKNPVCFSEKSVEYAPDIIHAVVSNKIFRFNGNVRNTGLITNLQQQACVEVPCFVDRLGVHPCYVGDLPPQCAALNRTNINVQELAVKGILSGNKELIYQAVMMDPLTAAVLSPEEIRKMVAEMFKAEKVWIEIPAK
ncbi:MAG: hypothetical protein A2096_17320 [Spirochaetes bacterium GWF1_41_5]|nr:MAG: hypothetical protein A2096_17320 [Spirochaetes bacterium GWF1_41_5]HBE00955.1 alpha-glucosidase/alpha-galactosidase [Spirochaetia bacterium]